MSGKKPLYVELAPSAVADIEAEVARLRWEAGDEIAMRFRGAVRACVDGLVLFPRRGRRIELRKLRGRELRRVSVPGFRNKLVFYRLSPTAVVVLRVIHAARDLEDELSRE